MNCRDYYNFHWQQKGGELKGDVNIMNKTDMILDIIPSDVDTIFDLGCGDGAITDVLATSYQLTAVDISWEAIRCVSQKTRAIIANAANVQFFTAFITEITCGYYKKESTT